MLGTYVSKGSFIFLAAHLDILALSIGSMSSPIEARPVLEKEFFVGLASALLCHTRFLAAENCSQHWFLMTSLLCSK